MPSPQLDLSRRLSAAHLEALRRGSAISDEVIAARGYRTIADRTELAALGFAPSQQRVPGLGALMEGLAVDYQAECPELETGDLTALVVRALLRCAAAIGDGCDAGDGDDGKKEIS